MPEINRFEGLRLSDLSDVERAYMVDMTKKHLSAKMRKGQALNSPEESADYLCARLAGRKNEVFGAIFLNNSCQIIAVEELFKGTANYAAVHPRVVAQKVLEHNATAVIFFHNHPSGCADPSRDDERITHRLKDAVNLMDCRVLDHIVVAGGDYASFAERGML